MGANWRVFVIYRFVIATAAALALTACASAPTPASSSGAVSPVTAQTLANLSTTARSQDYRVGALDLLSVTVFGVEELSFERIRVDASGNIQFPLLGSVQAAGLTVSELSQQLEASLAARYLQNPQVAISVMEAASQKVTVDGAVTEPGVYEMKGAVSLVQAVAMAKGPTRVSNLERVAVFRVVDGQRMVALFDLGAIRAGQAPDVPLIGDDIVIVDTSQRSVLFRELIGALPALAFFRPY